VYTLAGTSTLTIGGDLPVRRLGFGAMRLTGGPAHLDRATAIEIARHAVDIGVTFIDTADAYSLGDNEKLLAEALYPYQPGVVIATKGGQGAQVALAWLLHRSPVMVPIPGTSSAGHLDENVAAAGLALSAADMAQL
jgi:aryl-alcohol dehydrogenase-like predicted oxidoreductase